MHKDYSSHNLGITKPVKKLAMKEVHHYKLDLEETFIQSPL